MDGLPHDLRNPLNALALNVEVLQEKLSRASGGEVPAGPAKNLQALRDQVARLDVLLGQFTRFLTPPGALQGGTTLGTLAREAAAVLGHSARRAQVGLDVDPSEGERSEIGPGAPPLPGAAPAAAPWIARRPEDGPPLAEREGDARPCWSRTQVRGSRAPRRWRKGSPSWPGRRASSSTTPETDPPGHPGA
jgi:signal transduction histidine kinase